MSKKVNITIAGRTYPLTVSENEEQTVKLSEQKIQSNINKLTDRYKINDPQDLLAMTALEFATRIENSKAADLSEQDKKKLDEIRNLLDSIV